MARQKRRSVFYCQECGNESPRWLGKCPVCESWNSFAEEVISSPADARRRTVGSPAKPVRLSEAGTTEGERTPSGIGELDRVLGGGIVPGSVTLIAGDPGIGKSTLVTQLAGHDFGRPVLYIAGEESAAQIRLRADRLGLDGESLFILAETAIDVVLEACRSVEPLVTIVDSIQTMHDPALNGAPGSLGQVRDSAYALIQETKSSGMATFLVGHVTKDGQVAGPRVLEHMVDTVLYFEGDRHHAYRILRSVKNRFGSTRELGLFELGEHGLTEVPDPSRMFLSNEESQESGLAVVCSMEGNRPLLVEIQALVTDSSYGTPQRTTSGFDTRRLQVLLAVLEKRAGLSLGASDVFVNVAGGVRLEEPAVDLGVVLAVASSARNKPLSRSTFTVGEVGLTGEVRSVGHLEHRLREGRRQGFERVVISQSGAGATPRIEGLEVLPVRSVREALRLFDPDERT